MTDDLAWETLDREVAYTCAGFDVIRDRVGLPDGTEAPYDYVSEPQAVVVLPFTEAADGEEGDVLVIDEWRQPVDRMNRAIPAGSVEDEDDGFEAAARRELREETGYEAGTMEHLTTVEPANGFADSVFHYYVARDCVDARAQDLDAAEFIRTETVPFEELLDAAREDDLRDGRSMLGVLYYALFEQ